PPIVGHTNEDVFVCTELLKTVHTLLGTQKGQCTTPLDVVLLCRKDWRVFFRGISGGLSASNASSTCTFNYTPAVKHGPMMISVHVGKREDLRYDLRNGSSALTHRS
ncbi:MAG: hypothetical protein L6R35_006264, partial [Caloplaca aegaea]